MTLETRIITLRRQGYKLWRIAEITRIPQHKVAAVLVENGLALWCVLERNGETGRKNESI